MVISGAAANAPVRTSKRQSWHGQLLPKWAHGDPPDSTTTGCASRPESPVLGSVTTYRRPVAVRQGPEEGDDVVLLVPRQAKIAELSRVDVRSNLWRRPWHDIARVVEVDNGPEALEIAVVPVGLDEGRVG